MKEMKLYKFENEIKNAECFNRINIEYTVALLIFAVLCILNAGLLFYNKTRGYIVLACLVLLNFLILYFITVKIVFKFFKNVTNRKILKEKLSERQADSNGIRKIYNNLDFDNKLKFIYIFKCISIFRLFRCISFCKLNLIEILKKYNIVTKKEVDKLIEHYRFKVLSTSKSRKSLIAFLTFLINIIIIYCTIFENGDVAKILGAMVIIFVGISLFIAFIYVEEILLSPYTKRTFYKNMEDALTEINLTHALDEKTIS